MARVCIRHPFELSQNFCSHCGQEFCRDCLVYPKGPKKPALCVTCAIAVGGVRSTAAKHPPISKRELKRRMKERAEEDRLLARHAREPAPIEPITNPFTPGWAVGSEDHPAPLEEPEPVAVASAPLPPPPPAPAASLTPADSLAQSPSGPAPSAQVPAVQSPATPPLLAQPLPPPPPPSIAPDVFVRTTAPTLADLLPSVPPTPTSFSSPAETSPSLIGADHGFGLSSHMGNAGNADAAGNADEDEDIIERRPRTLPLLRRREPEPVDDGSDASEMIAWLDEVFAPKGSD